MRSGLTLLVLLLSLWLLFNLGRWGFFHEEPPAALLPLEHYTGVPVWLGAGFQKSGLHQFSDGEAPVGVMDLALTHLVLPVPAEPLWSRPLLPGERLDLFAVAGKGLILRRTFLPAHHRILLHIPLHPDRMDRRDWEALPGVGPKLATAIVVDRQKNGDFGTLEALDRVKGVGPGRLKQWREYFGE